MPLFQSIRGQRFGLFQAGARVWNLGSNGNEWPTPHVASFTLSSAQILALNATPISLVSAPGAGRVLIPHSLWLFLDYNAAAYAGIAAGEDLAVRYTNGSGAVALTVETTGFLDQTADQYRFTFAGAAPAATAGGVAAVPNAALVAHMTTGEITTGDSPIYGKLYYYNLPSTF